VSGGRWSDGATGGGGFFRVLLTQELAQLKGRKKPQMAPHVYVQWLERTTADGFPPYRIRATLPVPFDRDEVRDVVDVRLWSRGNEWLMSLVGYKHDFMDDFAHAEVVFKLGAPGQVSRVTGP
jgi:hypothetical protein